MPKDQAKIALILQSCLEKIQSGEGTLDTVLNDYPDLADILRPQLETALWLRSQSQAFDPQPEFITASRARLVRRVKYAVASTPPKQPAPFWLWLINLRQKKLAFQFALTALLVLSLVFSTNRLALAASHTLPGDMLYPVKITHENVRVFFAFSPEGDLELNTDFARERLVEIEAIILEGRYNHIPATVNAYDKHISRALVALMKVIEKKSQRAEELATQLFQVMSRDSRILGGYYQLVPQEVRTDLTRVEEISESGLSEMAGMPLVIAAILTDTSAPTSTQIAGVDPGETLTPVNGDTQAPTATIEQPTEPEETSEVSPTPGETSIPGITPFPSPTSTWWSPPGASPTATSTSLSPTATATPIQTTPLPTATPIVTNTPLPTYTPVVTDTPVLPTPVCNITGWILPIDPVNPGVRVVMNVSNNSGFTITITRIKIDWPKNHDFQKLELVETSNTIWDKGDATPPTTITDFKEGSEGLRQIPHGASQDITFRFFRAIGLTGYQITIDFDNGCSVTATK
jgi:hypothetical protein